MSETLVAGPGVHGNTLIEQEMRKTQVLPEGDGMGKLEQAHTEEYYRAVKSDL